jgi:hypothetical protein
MKTAGSQDTLDLHISGMSRQYITWLTVINNMTWNLFLMIHWFLVCNYHFKVDNRTKFTYRLTAQPRILPVNKYVKQVELLKGQLLV